MDSLRRSAVQNTADSIKQEEMGLRPLQMAVAAFTHQR